MGGGGGGREEEKRKQSEGGRGAGDSGALSAHSKGRLRRMAKLLFGKVSSHHRRKPDADRAAANGKVGHSIARWISEDMVALSKGGGHGKGSDLDFRKLMMPLYMAALPLPGLLPVCSVGTESG